jgi:hypothetical protein
MQNNMQNMNNSKYGKKAEYLVFQSLGVPTAGSKKQGSKKAGK